MTERAKWGDIKNAHRAEDPEHFDRVYNETRQAYELGVLVREQRTAAGLTQSELAQRTGMSQPAIARLEAGGTEPTIATLRRIAAALDIELVVEFHTPAGAA